MVQIKHRPSVRTHPIERVKPLLRQYGIAVESYPDYVNLRENQHALDAVLLSVIIRGRGRHVMGDETYVETGGSVAVTHYGQTHDIVTDRRGMHVYNVFLDLRLHPLPVVPEPLRATLSAILPIHPRFQHHLNRRVWIKIDRPERLAASLDRIRDEGASEAPGAREIVQHAFQVFLIDICRQAQRHGFRPSAAAEGAFPAWVETLRQGIDERFAQPHDLETLARNVKVSVAYLCRIFKAYTGKTVIEYLVERRIQAATWKLGEGDEKVLSIALGCGFNDLAYFNRAFKRIVGRTPSAYRKKIRQPVAQVRQRRRGVGRSKAKRN